jgi:predicted DCC family thiol-disulfide oxidoreductase YuxK
VFVPVAFQALNPVNVERDFSRGSVAFRDVVAETRSMALVRAPYSYRNDPAVPPFPDDRPIIVFDGYCALCAGWAAFALRHDRVGRYRLLSAQSPLGRALYIHYGLDPQDYETNILIENGLAWFKSEGSIRMAEGLGLPWSLAGIFRIMPRRLRDRLYEAVARNRLRWFGKRTTCYRPAATFAERFLG